MQDFMLVEMKDASSFFTQSFMVMGICFSAAFFHVVRPICALPLSARALISSAAVWPVMAQCSLLWTAA